MKIRLFLESGQTEEIEVREEDKEQYIQVLNQIANMISVNGTAYINIVDKNGLPCPFSGVNGMRLIL